VNIKFEEMLDASTLARQQIIETGFKNGVIVCPICGSRLAFAITSNGHVNAACKDKDCLRWSENA